MSAGGYCGPPNEQTLKGKRDRAVLAILLGCGLRRAEVAKLQVRDLQQREEHWAVVDLIGKGRHIRTVPVPDWVKATLDEWTQGRGHPGRATISVCEPFRRDLGRRDHRKGGLAYREGQRKASWHLATGAPRLPAHMRQVVSCSGRRTGANSIPAGPRFKIGRASCRERV